MKKIVIIVFLASLTNLIPIYAQTSEAPFKLDKEIEEMLTRRKMFFYVLESSDNEFRIDTDLGNGRGQAGFIDSRVQKINNDYYRDIMSLVWVTPELPSQTTLYHILKRNSELEMGFFEMFYNGNDFVVRYKNRVLADLSERDLLNAYFYGITVSDELENEITEGKDIE